MTKNKLLIIKLLSAFICIILFGLIRSYQNSLFYDPLITFFETDYKNSVLPNFDLLKLVFSYGFRFFINSIISIALIYIFFRDKEVLKISFFLYAILFFLLLIAIFIVLQIESDNYMLLFYVRRFLMQPLFVLLFIPAFYFQKLSIK